MVFVDKLSKMVHLLACNKSDGASEVAGYVIEHVFRSHGLRSHGLPRTLVSDRDPRFTSNIFKEICRLLRCKQAMSTAFHPETDEEVVVERWCCGTMCRRARMTGTGGCLQSSLQSTCLQRGARRPRSS